MEPKFQPVVLMPRVQKQGIAIKIALIGSPHIGIHVLIPVVVQIRKANPMPFLEMSHTG